MTKEDSRKVKRLFLCLRLERDFWDNLIEMKSIESEVTRALEPTYSYSRSQLLQKISEAQKSLNKQKNLLTKISKVLRKVNSPN